MNPFRVLNHRYDHTITVAKSWTDSFKDADQFFRWFKLSYGAGWVPYSKVGDDFRQVGAIVRGSTIRWYFNLLIQEAKLRKECREGETYIKVVGDEPSIPSE